MKVKKKKFISFFFFFQAEDGIRDSSVTGVQTCALPISTLDFALREAAVALEAVEVVHHGEPSFEVQRNDVSALVVTNEILNLPLNSRNTINLAAVVPGLKTFAPTQGRSLPAAGSLPDLRFWNFYLDGAEWKSFFNGNLVGIPQTGSPLPQEAMREFRVHLNPY